MATRNELLEDIVIAAGGIIDPPKTRNNLLQQWLNAVDGTNPIFQTDYTCQHGIEPRLGTGPADYTCATTAQYSAACNILDRYIYGFDGAGYITIPTVNLVAGDVVEFSANLSKGVESTYKFLVSRSGVTVDRVGIRSAGAGGTWQISGYTLEADGIAITDGSLYSPLGDNVHIKLTVTTAIGIDLVACVVNPSSAPGSFYTETIYNLSITAASGNRFYPIDDNDTVVRDTLEPEFPELWSAPLVEVGTPIIDGLDFTIDTDGTNEAVAISGIGEIQVEITFDLELATGSVLLSNAVGATLAGSPAYTSSGSYSIVINADAVSSGSIGFKRNTGVTLATISNISVKETTQGELVNGDPANWIYDEEGVIRTAAIDQPRIEKEGVVCNGAVTNIIDTDVTTWLKLDGGTANSVDVINPAGSLGAYEVDISSTGTSRVASVITNSTTQATVFSVYLKAKDGESGNYPIALRVGNITNSELVFLDDTKWRRYDALVDTATVAGDTVTYIGKRDVGGDLFVAYAWTPNATALPFPVNPIYGLNTTQAATNLTYPVPAGFDPAGPWTIEVEFDYFGLLAARNQNVFHVANSSDTIQRIRVYVKTDGRVEAQYRDAITIDTLTSAAAINTNESHNVKFINDGVTLSLVVNGAIVSKSKVASPTGADEVRVGRFSNGVEHAHGHVKSLKISDYDILGA